MTDQQNWDSKAPWLDGYLGRQISHRYWTEDHMWFSGVVRARASDGTVRVIYDKDHVKQRLHERTFVHDLHVERWRLESS